MRSVTNIVKGVQPDSGVGFEDHEEETDRRRSARRQSLTQFGFVQTAEAASLLKQRSQQGAADLADIQGPFLVNISDDPLLSGIVIFKLDNGISTVGSGTGSTIVLRGLGMRERTCSISVESQERVALHIERADVVHRGSKGSPGIQELISSKSVETKSVDDDDDGQVSTSSFSSRNPAALPARVTVNGVLCTIDRPLEDKDVIIFGRAHKFQLKIPKAQKSSDPTRLEETQEIILQSMFHEEEELRNAESCVEDWVARGHRQGEILSFLTEWKELHHLVGEAHDILEEMPDHSDFSFEIKAMTSLLVRKAAPSFAVVVTRPITVRSSASLRRTVSDFAPVVFPDSPAFDRSQRPLSMGQEPLDAPTRRSWEVVAIWQKVEFQNWLDELRDIHTTQDWNQIDAVMQHEHDVYHQLAIDAANAPSGAAQPHIPEAVITNLRRLVAADKSITTEVERLEVKWKQLNQVAQDAWRQAERVGGSRRTTTSSTG